MSESKKITGTSDVNYDLVSVIYHALQGAETYESYVRDAEEAGDRELSRFLSDVQEENRRRVSRARELLIERWGVDGSSSSTRAAEKSTATDRGKGEHLPGAAGTGQVVARIATDTGRPNEEGGPYHRQGLQAGSDDRYANRSFEEVEPDLRRAYEAQAPDGDAWERLREQVREGFTQARQR